MTLMAEPIPAPQRAAREADLRAAALRSLRGAGLLSLDWEARVRPRLICRAGSAGSSGGRGQIGAIARHVPTEPSRSSRGTRTDGWVACSHAKFGAPARELVPEACW